MQRELRPRLLVVDDEPNILEMLSDVLVSQDYECVTADGGRAAIERVAAAPFDLVILDMKMPGMSGVDTLQQIKQGRPDQRVVMLSADREIDTALAAMELGALDYIVKPFSLRGLVGKVRDALARGPLCRGA